MQIHQIIKDTITQHAKKIELIQWAIVSSVSSLVYSEYIKNITQKQVPVRMILVPSMKTLNELLHPNGQFVQLLSEKLIDGINNNKLFQKYAHAPELILFNDENVEILKTIFDLYIAQHISQRIPETIGKKFYLLDGTQQLFRENREADLFNRKPISERQLDYIVEESVLQLLLLLPTMKKDIELPEQNLNIHLTAEDIITIDHENALGPIHFNEAIIENKDVIDLLKFVTSTTIRRIDGGETAASKNGMIVNYSIDTNVFNQVVLTKLSGIEYNNESNT